MLGPGQREALVAQVYGGLHQGGPGHTAVSAVKFPQSLQLPGYTDSSSS